MLVLEAVSLCFPVCLLRLGVLGPHIKKASGKVTTVVSSSWDKLTPVTEEGTKLVCSSLFFLAFYKNRHKNRNGNEKAIHLRVERPCVSRRVSACLRPKTKRGEKLLL